MLPISESDALEGELGSTAETTTQKKADSDTGALGGDARSTPGPSGTPGRSGASAYPDIAEKSFGATSAQNSMGTQSQDPKIRAQTAASRTSPATALSAIKTVSQKTRAATVAQNMGADPTPRESIESPPKQRSRVNTPGESDSDDFEGRKQQSEIFHNDGRANFVDQAIQAPETVTKVAVGAVRSALQEKSGKTVQKSARTSTFASDTGAGKKVGKTGPRETENNGLSTAPAPGSSERLKGDVQTENSSDVNARPGRPVHTVSQRQSGTTGDQQSRPLATGEHNQRQRRDAARDAGEHGAGQARAAQSQKSVIDFTQLSDYSVPMQTAIVDAVRETDLRGQLGLPIDPSSQSLEVQTALMRSRVVAQAQARLSAEHPRHTSATQLFNSKTSCVIALNPAMTQPDELPAEVAAVIRPQATAKLPAWRSASSRTANTEAGLAVQTALISSIHAEPSDSTDAAGTQARALQQLVRGSQVIVDGSNPKYVRSMRMIVDREAALRLIGIGSYETTVRMTDKLRIHVKLLPTDDELVTVTVLGVPACVSNTTLHLLLSRYLTVGGVAVQSSLIEQKPKGLSEEALASLGLNTVSASVLTGGVTQQPATRACELRVRRDAATRLPSALKINLVSSTGVLQSSRVIGLRGGPVRGCNRCGGRGHNANECTSRDRGPQQQVTAWAPLNATTASAHVIAPPDIMQPTRQSPATDPAETQTDDGFQIATGNHRADRSALRKPACTVHPAQSTPQATAAPVTGQGLGTNRFRGLQVDDDAAEGVTGRSSADESAVDQHAVARAPEQQADDGQAEDEALQQAIAESAAMAAQIAQQQAEEQRQLTAATQASKRTAAARSETATGSDSGDDRGDADNSRATRVRGAAKRRNAKSRKTRASDTAPEGTQSALPDSQSIHPSQSIVPPLDTDMTDSVHNGQARQATSSLDGAKTSVDKMPQTGVAVALHPRAASGELVYPTESVNPLTDLDRADDPCNPTVVQPADAIDSSYAAWNSDSEMQCDDAGDTRDTSGSDDAPGSHAPTESVADTCARNTIDAVTHDGPTGTSMPLSQIAHMASDTEHSDADRADSSTPRAFEVEPGPRGLSSASPTLSL